MDEITKEGPAKYLKKKKKKKGGGWGGEGEEHTIMELQ